MKLRPASRDRDLVPADGIDDGEPTLPEEEWPVSELYQVTPSENGDEAVPRDDDGRTAIVRGHPAATARRRRRPTLGLGLAVLIAVALIVALVSGGILLFAGGPEQAGDAALAPDKPRPADNDPAAPTTPASAQRQEVPDVIGLRLDEARTELSRADLTARVRRIESSMPRDEVLAQSPAAGKQASEGGMVLLTISLGTPAKQEVNVPDVLGMSAADASKAIRDAGLRPSIQTVPSSERAGTVVGQSPAPGTEIDSNGAVRLRVARAAPLPAARIAVPDVVGMTLSEAQRRIRDASLRSTVTRVASSEAEGTVVGQSPRTGARADKGDAVALRVSSGPAETAVPDVTGLDEQAARAELQSAGFDVQTVSEPTTDPSQDGMVVSQDPRAGSNGPEGSVVTITVARLG
jgi:beta-lactam-binding protein with PASTA domain